VVVAGGLYVWDQLRFPARSEAIAGTAVTLRIQDSVDARSRLMVREGITLMHRYLDGEVGGVPHEPVEARLASSNPCEPFASLAGGDSSGVATPGRLCINTARDSWPTALAGDGLQAKLLAAHEYAHIWQAENGCYFEEDDHTHQWLFEGIATYLSWRALTEMGGEPEASVRENLRFYRAGRAGLPPLLAHEREGGSDSALYAKWHLAVRRLVALSRAAGDRSLLRFCRAVARGSPWRRAFADSFGVSVKGFYRAFER
jgi:hypothetical protein